ncbi:uncharacterized protein F4822DRAFT_424277 [Hypoxylon trugodes]|uniref:uncharacterized protein n=1 Tax=Hypoxylon trugodes TaxID=326681 RepID=UPI00219FE3D5|nr:uncharacterized protein F4822DRAFT_424277 [Hypoxylon trugodes]KAI1393815.1 hypothetical protein F4822DRAFT_424277 [Hypoxylon trugodes]
MATPVEINQDVYSEGTLSHKSSRSSFSEHGDVRGPMRDINDDALSMVSYPDLAGRKGFTSPDHEASKSVYEAWEVLLKDDTVYLASWKLFCGIKYGCRWSVYDDGFLDLRPLTSYGQGELADLHESAVQEYEAKHSKKGTSYAQDLANRVSDLEDEVYTKVQHLIESKMATTNRTPFRRREWRVVVLEESEYLMTELPPQRKKNLFWRCRQEPSARKVFLIIHGEEVKATKEEGGWRLFNRHSNPWWRIDARETQEARKEHQQHFDKVDQRLAMRRRPIVHDRPSVKYS